MSYFAKVTMRSFYCLMFIVIAHFVGSHRARDPKMNLWRKCEKDAEQFCGVASPPIHRKEVKHLRKCFKANYNLLSLECKRGIQDFKDGHLNDGSKPHEQHHFSDTSLSEPEPLPTKDYTDKIMHRPPYDTHHRHPGTFGGILFLAGIVSCAYYCGVRRGRRQAQSILTGSIVDPSLLPQGVQVVTGIPISKNNQDPSIVIVPQ